MATPPQSSSSSTSWSSWSASSVKNHEPLLRIGVVGGGIAGLTLAQLLHGTPNVQVTVYERSFEAVDRLCGYRVMLSYFVLQNLQATLRREVWTRVAASIGIQPQGGQELQFMKSSGTQMFTFDNEEMRDSFSVSRWPLRKALLYGYEDFVKFGKVFQRYERLRSNAIKIHFEDRSTDECDLLIGADGAGSRVRRQLIPEARVTETDLAVIYFKIPLTPDTKDLLPTNSASMVFTQKNQNIMVHSWINPRKMWATKFDDFDISNEESFIMFGHGGPVREFINKSKPPTSLSSAELKTEIIARVKADPKIDPKFVALAEHCVLNTSYVHAVRDCQAVKKWDTGSVTLMGDAVFNISTMLGKGANCALLDAVDLAETLRRPDMLNPSKRRIELRKRAEENVKRRMKERQRAALIQNLVYFGDNKLKEFCRDQGLKMAFDWIDDTSSIIPHER
ncbi:FAD/NAD(P)-binding domain-containing protein [Mollisia scopiformis]|uniref:FAD/NAD(P)-binding domain-containing protein n=1 Tax=Mollisia scopiformis TaxID=149040 RepID=A0A194XQH0_MOLSC|nr:FAD/NAD(P)-binding domain-containing protein [Mollisia scopiformis]KUJ22438.1 FAD/NAD(P)-binding domain-containing protein [Mollisia scopiformis]